jgi:hypothetical protein
MLVALIACSFVGTRGLEAETISYPKDNPAFTLEVPKGEHASFNDAGHLSIGAGFRLFELKKQGADEKEIQKTMHLFVLALMNSRLRPAEDPKVEPKKVEIAPGLSGYVAEGWVKSQPSFDSSGGAYFFSAAMSQVKDGRFFFADSYEVLGGPDLMTVLSSIKLINK